MSNKALTLSVIIPAYNEENHLKACLDAIAAQSVAPDEVIVVDNNSVDNTIAIARSYSFVKIVQERKQGMIPARNRGLNIAKSDILARIDADSRVTENWVQNIKANFVKDDVMAVSGIAKTLLLPNTDNLYTTFWSRMYMLWARMQYNIPIVWGGNMAIRRNAWQIIKRDLQTDDKLVHEDQDISVVLSKYHLSIKYDESIVVTTPSQDKNEWPKYREYVWRMIMTQYLHHKLGSFDDTIRLYTPLQRLGFLFFIFLPLKIVYLMLMVASTLTYYLRRAIPAGYAKYGDHNS